MSLEGRTEFNERKIGTPRTAKQRLGSVAGREVGAGRSLGGNVVEVCGWDGSCSKVRMSISCLSWSLGGASAI